MTVSVAPLPASISESDFLGLIVNVAVLHRWMVHHSRPAPVTGHAGLPDLILSRAGVVILAELKVGAGKLSVGQSAWLAALGPYGRVWHPEDWPEIVVELGPPRRAFR